MSTVDSVLHKRSSSSTKASAGPSKKYKLDVHPTVNQPLLVSFPGGVPATIDDAQIVALRQMTGKGSRTKVKAVFNEKLTFEGSDYNEQSTKKDCFAYAVGVVRKGEEGKMHVFPCGHSYVLRPQASSTSLGRNASLGRVMTNAERKESLTQEFGSKKKKSQARAAKSNQISSENIAGASDLKTIMAGQSDAVTEEMVEEAQEVAKRARMPKRR